MWLYLEDRRRTLDNATDKLMLAVTEFAAEIEREKASQRVTDVMHRKFAAGHVTGGRLFGYDNLRVNDHVERRVNDREAAVVIEVYERYARGEGYRAIAWTLNARQVPAPRAQRGRPHGWEPSTIRSLLGRSTYRGEEVYNQSRKRTTWGNNAQCDRPETEWLRRPGLRIISPALAEAVDARREDRASRYLRASNGRLIGRPPIGGRYLLSGLLKCPCGATFEALKAGNWTSHGAVYVCGARRRKGPAVCNNSLTLPIAEADEDVLSIIEGEALTPAFVTYVLDTLATGDLIDRPALQEERDRVAREVENLTQGIAEGGDIPALVALLKARDKRLKKLDQQLAPHEHPDREVLRLALEQRVEDWRAILRSNPRQARMVLHQLIGPIRMHNEGDRPSWIAPLRPAGLLAGMVPGGSSPTGFEPVFWP